MGERLSSPRLADRHFFHLHRASGRALVALVCGGAVGLLVPESTTMRLVCAWGVFALVLSILAWTLIWRASPARTQAYAGAGDPGRAVVMVLALSSSLFSLFAALLLVSSAAVARIPMLLAVVAAWFLTHTTFALRYAHMYYRDESPRGGEGVGGLTFPGDSAPCYFDFAYFSFTIGMCFQVSDIAITSSMIRRTVLLHSVLSYIYSTVVLALALNLIFARLG